METVLKIQYIDKAKLQFLEGNPRKVLRVDASEKLQHLIKKHGFRNPLEVWREKDKKNNGTGKYSIICGNHRYEAGLKLKMAKFPVTVFTGTRKEALTRAISDNASSGWTGWDEVKLDDMFTEIDVEGFDIEDTGLDRQETNKMFNIGDEERYENGIIKRDQDIWTLREDVIFNSNNKYGIPDLLPEMCGEIDDNIKTWAGHKLDKGDHKGKWLLVYNADCYGDVDPKNSYLSFYTSDVRFDKTWNEAVVFGEFLLDREYAGVLSPNYSLCTEDPIAYQIWNIYRSRWISRYWQELGIKVIPDISWTLDESLDFCFLGIPKGLPCVAVQAQATATQYKKWYTKGLRTALDLLEPKTLLVYTWTNKYRFIESIVEGRSEIVFCQTRAMLRHDLMSEAKGRSKKKLNGE